MSGIKKGGQEEEALSLERRKKTALEFLWSKIKVVTESDPWVTQNGARRDREHANAIAQHNGAMQQEADKHNSFYYRLIKSLTSAKDNDAVWSLIVTNLPMIAGDSVKTFQDVNNSINWDKVDQSITSWLSKTLDEYKDLPFKEKQSFYSYATEKRAHLEAIKFIYKCFWQ